ncbi:DUF4231 domain-containing protein [Rhizobium ruizarguesonis]|uniref:DUF4231 domain-containing protein n=1 Tax=Rhizobium ruizarguesonis TaxID=2081791 RepID=UPI0038572CC5
MRTANRLISTAVHTRWATLTLSITAALLAAIASQPEHDASPLRPAVAIAVLLGVVSFLNSRLLGGPQFVEWNKIRAASEAFKGAIYTGGLHVRRRLQSEACIAIRSKTIGFCRHTGRRMKRLRISANAGFQRYQAQ